MQISELLPRPRGGLSGGGARGWDPLCGETLAPSSSLASWVTLAAPWGLRVTICAMVPESLKGPVQLFACFLPRRAGHHTQGLEGWVEAARERRGVPGAPRKGVGEDLEGCQGTAAGPLVEGGRRVRDPSPEGPALGAQCDPISFLASQTRRVRLKGGVTSTQKLASGIGFHPLCLPQGHPSGRARKVPSDQLLPLSFQPLRQAELRTQRHTAPSLPPWGPAGPRGQKTEWLERHLGYSPRLRAAARALHPAPLKGGAPPGKGPGFPSRRPGMPGTLGATPGSRRGQRIKLPPLPPQLMPWSTPGVPAGGRGWHGAPSPAPPAGGPVPQGARLETAGQGPRCTAGPAPAPCASACGPGYTLGDPETCVQPRAPPEPPWTTRVLLLGEPYRV